MKIIDTTTGKTVATIVGGNNMTLDEAIALVGAYDNEAAQNGDPDVVIDGNEYYWENLDTVAD